MRTPAFFPPNACDFRQHCRAGPNLAGRFPGETPQTAQPGSRSKVIVRLGTPSPMVTDDYRRLPKGSVRPGSLKNHGPGFQIASNETAPGCHTVLQDAVSWAGRKHNTRRRCRNSSKSVTPASGNLLHSTSEQLVHRAIISLPTLRSDAASTCVADASCRCQSSRYPPSPTLS